MRSGVGRSALAALLFCASTTPTRCSGACTEITNFTGVGKLLVDLNVPYVYPNSTNLVAIAAGSQHQVGLRVDGTVAVWLRPGSDLVPSIAAKLPPPTGLSNVVAVAAGWFHNLAVKCDGTVVAWGDGFNDATNVPAGLDNVIAVSAEAASSLALRNDGTVVAWGDDSYRQLSVPSNLTNAVAIAAAGGFNAALRADGTVTTWGTIAPATTGVSNVVAISASHNSLAALRSDGTVWTPADGTLPGLSNVVAVAVGFYQNLALNADGALLAWGSTNLVLVSGVTNIATIASRGSSLALADTQPVFRAAPVSRTNYSGTVATFSVDVEGTSPVGLQWFHEGSLIAGKTNNALMLANVQLADAGAYSVVATNAFGSVQSSNAILTIVDGPPVFVVQPADQRAFVGQTPVLLRSVCDGTQPIGYQWYFNGEAVNGATDSELHLQTVTRSQSGEYWLVSSNSYGMTNSAHSVVTVLPVAVWGGNNSRGQHNVPLNLTNPVSVSCGDDHTVALTEDGKVLAWGRNGSGQSTVPQDLTNAVWAAASRADANNGRGSSVGVLENGSVIGWGSTLNRPPNLTNVVTLALGSEVGIALNTNGSVTTWGSVSPPIEQSNFVSVAAGRFHVLALGQDGRVAVTGRSTYGQSNQPPATLTNAVAVACGAYFSMALKSDGTVVAWGDNSYGQCNVPSGLTGVVAIAGGDYTSLAIKTGGSVVIWGRGDSGQTNSPAGLSNVVAISAGLGHCVALIGEPTNVVRVKPVLQQPGYTANRFVTQTQTRRARTYLLEAARETTTNWTVLNATAGNGSLKLLSDPDATNVSRFYRVREQ